MRSDKKTKEKIWQELMLEESGCGFGDPVARDQHYQKINQMNEDRKIAIEKSNKHVNYINMGLTACNILLLAYQIFFLKS